MHTYHAMPHLYMRQTAIITGLSRRPSGASSGRSKKTSIEQSYATNESKRARDVRLQEEQILQKLAAQQAETRKKIQEFRARTSSSKMV